MLRDQPALRGYITIRAADAIGSQMLNVAIGWYVYAATHNPMSLAYVGLAQFLPNILMVLIAGHAADRFDRRMIIGLSLLVKTLCLAAFGIWSAVGTPSPAPVYLLLFLEARRALFGPGDVGDPAAPGELRDVSACRRDRFVDFADLYHRRPGHRRCGLRPRWSGRVCGDHRARDAGPHPGASALAWHACERRARNAVTDTSILAGIRYIRSNRLLLGLISLDLFAVLLGGVTALADLRQRHPRRRSAWPGLSPLCTGRGRGRHRFLSGTSPDRKSRGPPHAFLRRRLRPRDRRLRHLHQSLAVNSRPRRGRWGNMVSMVVRQTLVQVTTPDLLRGRVSAVNFVFIGASNELGEFESGTTAALFGTVPAALLGGIGTLTVVALWATLFPELRHADKLEKGDGTNLAAATGYCS